MRGIDTSAAPSARALSTLALYSAETCCAQGFFLPSTIPYENLGPFGHFTKYLVDNHPKLLYNGFWLAWGIHIAEALYSIKLCKTKGITDSSVQRRWFIQTFLFGIASLSHLLAYKPPPKKQR
uniref:Transmembrane protein 254 n=1 Tax=Terrapene triunguis TaxID=2587831 RepID=A0A674IJE5_9SAUR